jgi:hypothetical protein
LPHTPHRRQAARARHGKAAAGAAAGGRGRAAGAGRGGRRRSLNTCRKDFTPLEVYEKGRWLQEVEDKAAKERKGRKGQERSEEFKEQEARGDTRDKVAAVFNVSGPTYEKIKAVGRAAEAETDSQDRGSGAGSE